MASACLLPRVGTRDTKEKIEWTHWPRLGEADKYLCRIKGSFKNSWQNLNSLVHHRTSNCEHHLQLKYTKSL